MRKFVASDRERERERETSSCPRSRDVSLKLELTATDRSTDWLTGLTDRLTCLSIRQIILAALEFFSLHFHVTAHTCHNRSHRAAIIMHQLSARTGRVWTIVPLCVAPSPPSSFSWIDLSASWRMNIDRQDCTETANETNWDRLDIDSRHPVRFGLKRLTWSGRRRQR